jgi:hypothetical protein
MKQIPKSFLSPHSTKTTQPGEFLKVSKDIHYRKANVPRPKTKEHMFIPKKT